MTRLVGYARTSTETQDAGLEAQIVALSAANCDVIFNEQVSSVAEREEFDAALADLQPGDTLVVCKLDRLARSVLGLWKIVEILEQKGCGLRILNFGGEVVDTRSATGKLILTIFAGFAQFEREMMLERQKPGIAKAKSEGKYKGRKRQVADDAREEIRRLVEEGLTVSDVARMHNLSRTGVYKIMAEPRLTPAG